MFVYYLETIIQYRLCFKVLYRSVSLLHQADYEQEVSEHRFADVTVSLSGFRGVELGEQRGFQRLHDATCKYTLNFFCGRWQERLEQLGNF